MRSLWIIFPAFLVSVACRPRNYNSSAVKDVSTPAVSGEIVGFSWSTGGGNLENQLRNQTRDAHSQNRAIADVSQLPNMAEGGYGTYIANDPVMSIAFGEDLSCVSIKPKASFTVLASREDRALRLQKIQSPNDAYLYRWGTDLVELNKGWAAVIRSIEGFSLEKSSKFSLKNLGNMQGLSPQKLSEARIALQAGQLCKALSAYDGEYGSFIYSWMNAIIDWKAEDPDLWGEIFPSTRLMKTPSSTPALFPDLATGVKAIAADTALVQELVAAGKTSTNASQAILEKDITSALLQALDSQLPTTNLNVTLAKHLVAKSGFLKLPDSVSDIQSYNAARFNAFVAKLETWEAAHTEEVQFMRDFWQQLKSVSIARKAKDAAQPQP
jgi:hypothetical protein